MTILGIVQTLKGKKMSKCTKGFIFGVLALFTFWIAAWIPELLDANIMPRPGQKTVWWGFQWIITSGAVIFSFVGLTLYSFRDCMEEGK
jgi:hypothetical protein